MLIWKAMKMQLDDWAAGHYTSQYALIFLICLFDILCRIYIVQETISYFDQWPQSMMNIFENFLSSANRNIVSPSTDHWLLSITTI